MNSLTGQYECAHRSAFGLDYFTARLDRLTLYANGRFALITQGKSRIMHAAKTLASGQQASMDAPETNREGTYSSQGNQLFLSFDDGEQSQAQIQDAGVQIGQDYFEKVSDTTFMPPPQRVKSNMEDIAKGLKLAGSIGGTVMKAARAIQGNLQSTPPASNQSDTGNSANPGQTGYGSPLHPGQSAPPSSQQPWSSQPVAQNPVPSATPYPTQADEALFCDQCGAPVRPGKRFCNKCGTRLS